MYHATICFFQIRILVVFCPSGDESLIQLLPFYCHVVGHMLYALVLDIVFFSCLFCGCGQQRFVVVRDPAERLVSGFLNKCVKEGYERCVVEQG